MKQITLQTREERKKAYERYLSNHVPSAPRYIAALEKGFFQSPIGKYESIYDISDPDLLKDKETTRGIRSSKAFSRKTNGGTDGLAGLNWYIKFLEYSRDSYYDFMSHFGINKKAFFEWGMKAIIFPPLDKVESEWISLKERIINDCEVYIRGYGRDAHGTNWYLDFYKYLLNNSHVKKDRSNNSRPQSIIRKITGLARNKDIYNYQVSHIWGRTKNIFMFEAPWNICYTPKIIDPFTGHETKGDLPGEFQSYLIKHAQKRYGKFIDDYNSIISSYDIRSKIDSFCADADIADERFKKDAIVELSEIEI